MKRTYESWDVGMYVCMAQVCMYGCDTSVFVCVCAALICAFVYGNALSVRVCPQTRLPLPECVNVYLSNSYKWTM